MILIAFSAKQLGLDPVILAMTRAIGKTRRDVVTQNIDLDQVAFDQSVYSDQFEAIIIFDAIEWYLENRIKLQGRPWVCSISTCFDSLMPFMTVNVPDVGIDCFFTNCKTFFDQVSQVAISHLYNKPVAALEAAAFDPLIGAVLPNIADRDFCLIVRAFKHFEKLGRDNQFRVSLPDCEKMPLPLGLPESAVIRAASFGDTARHLRSFSHLILCPRITDYRAGVVPEELRQAIHHKIPVLCLQHPILQPIGSMVTPMASTLAEFDALLTQVTDGKAPVKVTLDKPVSPSVEEFTFLVLEAFERSKHAST